VAAKAITVCRLGLSDYREVWDTQKTLFEKRMNQQSGDRLILCEHPHTYTIGRDGVSTAPRHLLLTKEQLNERGIALFEIDRGGDITYHGPGQLVGYPILDLNDYYRDVHRYLRDLEEVIIRTLKNVGIDGKRFPPHTGVWVDTAQGQKKICAIGVKVSRWITMHGFALNVNTDLNYFSGMVPCGIEHFGVTSIRELTDSDCTMRDVENHVINQFSQVFTADMIDIQDHLKEEML
jgi:lipoyl(octanoyl) transferase